MLTATLKFIHSLYVTTYHTHFTVFCLCARLSIVTHRLIIGDTLLLLLYASFFYIASFSIIVHSLAKLVNKLVTSSKIGAHTHVLLLPFTQLPLSSCSLFTQHRNDIATTSHNASHILPNHRLSSPSNFITFERCFILWSSLTYIASIYWTN